LICGRFPVLFLRQILRVIDGRGGDSFGGVLHEWGHDLIEKLQAMFFEKFGNKGLCASGEIAMLILVTLGVDHRGENKGSRPLWLERDGVVVEVSVRAKLAPVGPVLERVAVQ